MNDRLTTLATRIQTNQLCIFRQIVIFFDTMYNDRIGCRKGLEVEGARGFWKTLNSGNYQPYFGFHDDNLIWMLKRWKIFKPSNSVN